MSAEACKAAVDALGITYVRETMSGKWTHTPPGCFVHKGCTKDCRLHFGTGKGKNNGKFRAICYGAQACDETLSGTGGVGYRGCQSKTRSGRTCQKWTIQDPHAHIVTESNYPGKGVGNHNYCRNPDGDVSIWCYTMDAGKRWEYCDPQQACTDQYGTRCPQWAKLYCTGRYCTGLGAPPPLTYTFTYSVISGVTSLYQKPNHVKSDAVKSTTLSSGPWLQPISFLLWHCHSSSEWISSRVAIILASLFLCAA